MNRSLFVCVWLVACAPRAVVTEDSGARVDRVEGDAAVRDEGVAIDSATDAAESSVDASVDAVIEASTTDASMDGADVMEASAPSASMRVLFVGNSYTYVNDLPAMLTTIALRSRPSIAIAATSATEGGATLQLHWDSSGARTRLEERGWDAVVLQGQSVEPLWQPAVFGTYADRFGALARDVGARPLWFATWARRADSDVYMEPWSGGTFDAMTARLESGYAMAQTRNGGALVRVGEAWRRALAARPSLALHDGDGSHPTVAGTYLAACMFYELIARGELTTDRDFAAGLSEDDAAALRSVAVDVGRAP